MLDWLKKNYNNKIKFNAQVIDLHSEQKKELCSLCMTAKVSGKEKE